MTNLTGAEETSDDQYGRARSDSPEALVHAHGVERGDFPYHEHRTIGAEIEYDVLPDVDWRSPLPGPRCAACQEGSRAAGA